MGKDGGEDGRRQREGKAMANGCRACWPWEGIGFYSKYSEIDRKWEDHQSSVKTAWRGGSREARRLTQQCKGR